MRESRSRLVGILCAVGLCVATVASEAADYPITRGRQIIINRGIQLQSLVLLADGVRQDRPNFSDIPLWRSAYFTTFNFWNQPDTGGAVLPNLPAGQQWGKIWGSGAWDDTVFPPKPVGTPPMDAYNHWGIYDIELAYIDNLVDLQWHDEPNGIMTRLPYLANLFRTWNEHYPQALAHTNFCDGDNCQNGLTDAQLATYIQQTQPDILTFDNYPSFGSWTGYNNWYSSMQKYRQHALAGYTTSSGANSGPLPYGQFMKMFRRGYHLETANESFINLQHFASLAFGYTWLSTYLYNRYSIDYPVFFTQDGDVAGDQYPNHTVFYFEREANRQSTNLGKYLKRAVSTGVFNIPDRNNRVAPSNIPPWTERAGTIPGVADDYIVSITPTTGPAANGVFDPNRANTIVGYFMPLQYRYEYERAFANWLHFMIVNGKVDHNVTANDAGQWYRIVFDFTGSSENSLLRLNRDTGEVELLQLVPQGNNRYYLDFFLPGGVGDVFMFWNSANPIPGMQD